VSFQVIPRQMAFFDLFEEAVANVESAAEALTQLLDDLGSAKEISARITELEHAGDELTHRIIGLLNTTFVVPLDRHDILHLASSLDDVLDSIEAVADLIWLLRLTDPLPQLRQQASVLRRATTSVGRALRDLRRTDGVLEDVAEIKRQEREGDWVYRRAVADLYSGDFRAMEVLMWKDLLDETERAIDHCEDIGNTIESVVLKNA
jgi:predicted phosphate transport protein (TIGR00153 family)